MQLLSMREAAKSFNFPYQDIIRHAESGRLKAVRLNRSFKTTEEWMQQFLEELASNNRPKLKKVKVNHL